MTDTANAPTLKNPAKYVLIVFVSLILVFCASIYLIGLTLSGEINHKRKCQYNQSREKVWELLANIEASPGWRHPVVTRVEKLKTSDGKDLWREHYQGNDSTDIEIIEMNKPQKIVRKFIHGDFSGTWTIELKENNGKCEVWINESGQLQSPITRVFSKALIGASYIENYLRNIARHFKEAPNMESF